MAYNNMFPANYQPQYQMPQVPMPQPQPQMNSSITWVQGETGAKAYPVAPGNTVDLWDTEEQVIYLKSADASGLPSMKVLDYTVRESGKKEEPQLDTSKFVTYEDLEKKLAQLDAKVDRLSKKSNEYHRRNKERDDG